jgi:hypothetical protein
MRQRQYYLHREKGLKWRQYSKTFPGVLGFILFQPQAFGFSSTDWVNLKDNDFASLHRHINTKYISELCSAGKQFESSLDFRVDDVEFVGENLSLDKVPEDDLISCLRPVETTEEIVRMIPDWPRPEYWPDDWDWPVDPTFVPHGEKQCVECDQSECHCASRRPELQPRIRIYEGKGRGLQAVARRVGDVAYHTGTRLGWFVGKPVAPNTKHNNAKRIGWYYKMLRDDLDMQPTVAYLDCTEERNIYVLMNHHCEPTVHLVGKRVSGKYRLEVQAKRDIRDGEELTLDYGPDYWPGECPCLKHVI